MRTRRTFDPSNQNRVTHDCVDVFDTINYTNRYRFYNAMMDMAVARVQLARQMYAAGIGFGPVIRVNFSCPDEKEYKNQSQRFFEIMSFARDNGVIIETNVLAPVCMTGWIGRFLKEIATPGFRNLYDTAYHYAYPQTYNPTTGRMETAQTPIRISPEMALEKYICDTIFMSDGTIKTR